jgi:general L-amino acid transport system permease protein
MTRSVAALRWLGVNLFSTPLNAAFTLLLVYLAWRWAPPFFSWAVTRAIWSAAEAARCREAQGLGACWAFVAEKHRFILFGTYPAGEHWRAALALLLLISLPALSARRSMWRARLALFWAGGLALIALLLWGGILGLPYVENERWGGLVLTVLLAIAGMVLAFPLSVLLALGRRSGMPLVRALSTAYIEIIRGVPLISVLFMASVMLPLFLPGGVTVDKLLRAQLALALFAAAYLAEVVRGGLQALPHGQEEAAQALGLSYWQRQRLIILPQALRVAIPPMVNTFIGFLKDTSLVVIIGLFDLLTTIKVALNEPAWTGFGVEAYLFAALVYFLLSYPMSLYSRRLERELARGAGPPLLREN